MDIEELAKLSGQPARNIRFLISQGVVPPPVGARRWATYGDAHLSALCVYKECKAVGITALDVIKAKIDDAFNGNRAVGITASQSQDHNGFETIKVADGIELRLDAHLERKEELKLLILKTFQDFLGVKNERTDAKD